MARTFASGDTITRNNLPVIGSGSAAMGAISFRLKTTQTTEVVSLLGRAPASASWPGLTVILNYPTVGRIVGYAKNSSGGESLVLTSSGAVNNGVWRTFGWNYSIANGAANELFIDGASDGTANSAGAWYCSIDNAILGGHLDPFWAAYVGDMAEFAWWNSHLTAAEHAALGKGFKASRIRPQSLVSYVPMIREVTDLKDTALTLSGTAVESHPIIY